MTKKNEKSFLHTSGMLFGLNLLACGLNYLCQLVMARVLSVDSFGTINTIYSYLLITAVPGNALTMITARYYADYSVEMQSDARAEYLYQQQMVSVSLMAATAGLQILLLKPLSWILTIQEIPVLVLSFVLASLGFYQPLYSGVFSGTKHFLLVGIYSLTVPLYKLIAIGAAKVISHEDDTRLITVLLVSVIGVILISGYGAYKARKIVECRKPEKFNIAKLYTKNDVNTLFLNIGLTIYMNIDLLVVRYRSSQFESGLYSSVLLFGRIIYYFSTSLGTILLPSVASSGLSGKQRRRRLNKALFIMAGFSILCALPLSLFGDFFITFLFGETYVGAVSYLGYVILISVSLSFFTILMNYAVGIGNTTMAAATVLSVVTLNILVAYGNPDVSFVLKFIGISGIIGVCILRFLLHIQERDKK